MIREKSVNTKFESLAKKNLKCYYKKELFLFGVKDSIRLKLFVLMITEFKDSNTLCAKHTAGGNKNGTR